MRKIRRGTMLTAWLSSRTGPAVCQWRWSPGSPSVPDRPPECCPTPLLLNKVQHEMDDLQDRFDHGDSSLSARSRDPFPVERGDLALAKVKATVARKELPEDVFWIGAPLRRRPASSITLDGTERGRFSNRTSDQQQRRMPTRPTGRAPRLQYPANHRPPAGCGDFQAP